MKEKPKPKIKSAPAISVTPIHSGGEKVEILLEEIVSLEMCSDYRHTTLITCLNGKTFRVKESLPVVHTLIEQKNQ